MKKNIQQTESDGEPALLSPLKSFLYSIANLGYGMFFSFNNAIIPLYLRHFTDNPILLGLMGSTHSIEGAVIQPVVGTLSDRTRAKIGRRRPFILAATPVCCIFMAITPWAATLPESLRLGALIAFIFLFTVSFNVAFDPYQALMPDITPARQRGSVTGIWSLLGVLGQAGILMLDLATETKFMLVAGVMLATTAITCATTKEPDPSKFESNNTSHVDEWKSALRGLRTLRQARLGLLVFFVSGLGIGAVLPLLTVFVVKITHCTDQQAQAAFMVLMIATAASVLPCGWLTDKLGSKKMLLIALGLIGCAAIGALFVQTLDQIKLVLLVAGIGNAAQSTATYPLMTELVPREEVGWYTGLQTMALSIAQPLTVVLTGVLIGHGSYRAIFGVCAVCMAAAIFLLSKIHKAAAFGEIDQRNLEMGRAA